ncbi:hypothetical protein [Halorientalis salina]|uniref:hypothetical protein n=1 Tax=Halorientalis salina TaxID=2932266 RepID=UPI0010ABBD2A|nr:hypothetical protein [Halorientalis salina]
MSDADDGTEDRFAIPRRPQRRYPHSGGVEYDGETVFTLVPTPDRSTESLQSLVERALSADRYTFGDWFDLPMPLYLVNDELTGDVFRVSVRDGTVRFHVLPATESAGLRGLFERLRAVESELTWQVDCHVE